MIYENKFCHLVLNSKDYFYIFEHDNIGSLSYRVYSLDFELIDKHLIEESGVLKYAITLDKNNNINLIYLLKSGQLNLNIYDDLKWNSYTIGNLDTRANRYNHFEVLFVNDKLNLIFTYSNLINSNIYTIQHITYDNGPGEKYNIIRYISNKLGDPFVVDSDDLGTIHLLYNTITNNDSYIFHSFYSPFTRGWSNNPNELSSREVQNISPYLFVDSKSSLHGLWIESNKNVNSFKYFKMNIRGKEKYIWKPVRIPYISPDNCRPILYEEGKQLKLLYMRNNHLYYIYSTDYGNSWSREVQIETADNISIIKTSINNDFYPDIKARHILGSVGVNPKIYLLNALASKNKFSSKDTKSLYINVNHEDIDNHGTKEPKLVIEKEQDMEILLKEIENISQSNKELKILLDKILEKNEYILDKLQQIQIATEKNKSSFWDRWFN